MRSITVSTKNEMIVAINDKYNEVIIEGHFAKEFLKTIDFKNLSNYDMEKLLKLIGGIFVPRMPVPLKVIFPVVTMMGLSMIPLIAASKIGILNVITIYKDYDVSTYDKNKVIMKRKKQDALDYDDFIKLENDYSKFIMFSEKNIGYIEPVEKKKNKEIFRYSVVPKNYISMFNCNEDKVEYDILYVMSPLENNVYIKLYEFHEINFSTKYNEMLDMLQSLGATYIKISTVEEGNREFKGNLGSENEYKTFDEEDKAKKEKNNMGSKFDMSNKKSRAKRFEGTYTENTRKELHKKQLWYLRQEDWQYIAKARLELGLQEFNFEFEYTEDFGINFDFNMLISSIGAKMGGEFKEFKKEFFDVECRF